MLIFDALTCKGLRPRLCVPMCFVIVGCGLKRIVTVYLPRQAVDFIVDVTDSCLITIKQCLYQPSEEEIL